MAKYPKTLGRIEAVWNKLGGEEGVDRFLSGAVEIVIKSILDLVTTPRLPAQPRFVARDHFKVDTSDEAEVKIGWLGDNFQNWFLDKVEEPVEETELAFRTLTQTSLDESIRGELGREREETTLSQFWAFLKAQGKGEAGPLLTNGCWNIAYIRDAEGELRAVRARWRAVLGGWLVLAYSVVRPLRWREGFRVVSRK